MNVPKMRFRDFNNEYISKKLKDVFYFHRGNTLSKVDLIENGKNKCILYGELYTKYSAIANIIYSRTNNDSKNLIYGKKYDVLMPCSGETALDISTTTCLQEDNIIIGGDLTILRPINDFGNYLSYYLYYKKKIQIAKYAQGDSVVHLYADKIKNLSLNLPSYEEQKKVSRILELLDNKIELQSKKIEDLKLFKLSLKEKLFYMFPTNNKKLSEILIKWNKKNKDNKYLYVESVSNKFGFIAQNEQFEDRKVASNDTSNYYVIEKGVFAYNPSRLNVGSLALKQNDKVSLVSPLYECFTTNQNQNFMLEWFQSKEFKRGTFSKYEGGVRNTLNFNNLSSIEIKLPSLESQSKIVKVLNCYNKMIDLELEKLNKLLEFKKGLMQQLFI